MQKNTELEKPNQKAESKVVPLILTDVQEDTKIVSKNINQKENKFSPAARKIAAESKINLENFEGSGKNGLVLKEDLLHLMGTSPKPSERKISHGP